MGISVAFRNHITVFAHGSEATMIAIWHGTNWSRYFIVLDIFFQDHIWK